MIQKVDNLKIGDLIIVLGTFQDCVGIYYKHKIRDSIVVSIDYFSFWRNYNEHYWYNSIRTRHSTKQRVYKITIDNLNEEDLAQYNIIINKLRQDNKL